jgi:hypothetical protein
LCAAVKTTSALQHFDHGYIPGRENQKDARFDNQDCSVIVRDLPAASVVRGIGDTADSWVFHQLVNKDKALSIAKLRITMLMPYLYGNYINTSVSLPSHPTCVGLLTISHRQLCNAGRPDFDLRKLRDDKGFVNVYKECIVNPRKLIPGFNLLLMIPCKLIVHVKQHSSL